jgi:hypothetical protein
MSAADFWTIDDSLYLFAIFEKFSVLIEYYPKVIQYGNSLTQSGCEDI